MKEGSRKKKEFNESDFKNALIKKALGYDATEIVEEYSGGEQGEIVLTKKKVTKKNIPPDITALKILLDDSYKAVGELSDTELEQEKNRLLDILKANEKERKIEKS